MNLEQLLSLFCWFFFVFPKLPILFIPPSEINVNLIFEHCFRECVLWLRVQEAEKIRDCPYHVDKIIFTLEKYAKIRSSDSKPKKFKYKCIYDELKTAFFSLQSEARWEHISSWEVMINIAVTLAMRRQKLKVVKFLDDALIEDNRLAVFGPMQKFSENPEFLNYKFKKASSIMSVSEEYETLVRNTVLKELDRIKSASLKRNATELNSLKAELSQAEIVDFSVLICQHANSLVYFNEKNTLDLALRIIIITVCFPKKLAFDIYYDIVQQGDGREDFERIFKRLCEGVHQADPFAFAAAKNLFEKKSLVRAELPFSFQGFKKRQKIILDTPEKSHHFLRLTMIAFISRKGSCVDSYSVELTKVRHPLHALYDYHVLKSGHKIFDDLIVSLMNSEPSEVLNGLELKIRAHFFPNGDSVLSEDGNLKAELEDCIFNCSFESIKFLVEICSDMIELGKFVIEMVFRSRHLEILQYLLDHFWDRMDATLKEHVLELATFSIPFELFKHLFFKFPEHEQRNFDFKSLLEGSSVGQKFLTFEFLLNDNRSYDASLNLHKADRRTLIYDALECNLPEPTIRYYIKRFGQGLIGTSSAVKDFLVPATVSGLLNFIEEYKFCETSDQSKAAAIGRAAEENRKLTSAIIYVIDRYKPRLDDSTFLRLIDELTIYRTRDILQYLIEKIFGNEISAELKAEILIFLVTNFEEANLYIDTKKVIVQFCLMMQWTRPQIRYQGEPSQVSESIFGIEYMNSKEWVKRLDFIEECLDLVSY